MIEVFKTDVNDSECAGRLLSRIHETFEYCEANFDLDDCDKILRVKGIRAEGEIFEIITIAKELGCCAQILPDDYPSFDNLSLADEGGRTAIKI